MTLPNRDELWRWLARAPLPVVLSICITTTGAVASWVYAIASDVGDQKAVVAVAAEQARAANAGSHSNEARLIRLEEKLDYLMEQVADLRPRTDKEKNR